MSPLTAGYERFKGWLERPEHGLSTVTVTWSDYLVATWSAPAERLRALVPEPLSLDILPGPDNGAPIGFLQITCGFHKNAHWSPLGGGSSGYSYYECSYRVLVRRERRAGSFAVITDVSNSTAHVVQRTLRREIGHARFWLSISGNPVTGGYSGYRVRIVGDHGQTQIEANNPLSASAPAVPPPFGSFDDMTHFLTHREQIYAAATAPGRLVLAPLAFGSSPTPPQILQAQTVRATPFLDRELLTRDEIQNPLAVLIQPAVTTSLYPPRLISA